MKTNSNYQDRSGLHCKQLLSLRAGVLLLCLVAGGGPAQTYTVLHTFTGADGAQPYGGLVLSGTTLYGTTYAGGNFGEGTVFKVNTNGSGYTVLKSFRADLGYEAPICPAARLVLSGNTLYGTTLHSLHGQGYGGGAFKLNTDGSSYGTLLVLTGESATCLPHAELVTSGDMLYGTTAGYGSTRGTVFKVSTNGDDFVALHWFTGGSEGVGPMAGLVLSDSTLYGTSAAGGTFDKGTLFKINTDGSGFTLLKSFSGTDGNSPHGTLLLSGTTLYGTTVAGGNFGKGTVFQINTDGSGHIVLKSFNGTDGMRPESGVVLQGSLLFGTTVYGGNSWSGGAAGYGTVFQINTDGTGFTVLKNFTRGDGMNPEAMLVICGTTLFGTTHSGGDSNQGVLFGVTLTPPIIVRPPATQTAERDSQACFSVLASGAPILSYEWIFNLTNVLSVGTNDDLRLADLQSSDSGNYAVVVTNAFGAVTSAPVMLNVIAAVERRSVPGINLFGEAGSLLNVDYVNSISPAPDWVLLDTVSLISTSQYCFDLTALLPPQRFYRAWQTGTPAVLPSLNLNFVPAITLTGAIGSAVRVEGINQFGPTDAWFALDTVPLTNTSQLYFDVSAIGQPIRLYRLIPVP